MVELNLPADGTSVWGQPSRNAWNALNDAKLEVSDAAATYLSKVDAAAGYVPVTRGMLSSGTNFNDLRFNANVGAYGLSTTASYTNAPPFTSAAVLEVARSSGTNLSVVQRVTAGTRMWWREATDAGAGTWSPWREVQSVEDAAATFLTPGAAAGTYLTQANAASAYETRTGATTKANSARDQAINYANGAFDTKAEVTAKADAARADAIAHANGLAFGSDLDATDTATASWVADGATATGGELRKRFARAYSVPEGATTAEVQAVLDAAGGAGGGVVVFPPGFTLTLSATLMVPSGVRVVGNGAVLTQPATGPVAAVALEPGVSRVSIDGLDLRGPWYGLDVSTFAGGGNLAAWYADFAENIGVDIRGRWYQREVLGLSGAQMGALVDEHTDVTVRGCRVEGFGQSGIVADQVTRFAATGNVVRKCGRDGIRMYGVVGGHVVDNHVEDLFPAYSDGLAPNFNMYGVTATRLYGKAGHEDPNLTIGRPSADVLIRGNVVRRCPTWKGLDTHGGVRIRFEGNIVEDCHIGIGIDKGGFTAAAGVAPVRDVAVIGNTIRSTGATPYMRAGVAVYGHDGADQILNGAVISGNTFDRVGGGDTDAALSLSNARDVTVTGNVFRDCPRAAVGVVGTVTELAVTGNVIDNPRAYVTTAVTSGGSGYTSPPTVTLSGGGGSGAVAVARVAGGVVTEVRILHPGFGYSSAPSVTITGGGGSGAAATATLTQPFGVLSTTGAVRGTIGGNTFVNRTESTLRAVSLALRTTGFGVRVGRDQTYSGAVTPILSPGNEHGGTQTMSPRGWANVNLNDTAATLSAWKGIASVTRTGVGAVTVVMDEPFTAGNTYTAHLTAKGNIARTFSVNAIDGQSFTARVFDASGNPIDAGFLVTVTGY